MRPAWLYLATVIDCHTRMVIGWAADDNCKTPLIEKAIGMAARNYPLAEGAIFHSGRGSNYTSARFARTLKDHQIRHSAGRTGICPLTGQSPGSCRSATRHVVRGCLPAGDVSDTPVRHEHGGFLAAA